MTNERIVLQFGETANSCMINFWNYLHESKEDDAGDGNIQENHFDISKCMVYSQPRPWKGILGESPLNSIPSTAQSDELIAEKTGHWTDFNYYHNFTHNQYHESPLFDPSLSFSQAYFDSSLTGQLSDRIEDDLRRLAEACDALEQICIVAEAANGAMATATLQTLILCNEEFSKKNRLAFGFEGSLLRVQNTQAHWTETHDSSQQALQLAITYLNIKKQATTYIPLHVPSTDTPGHIGSLFYDALLNQNIPCIGTFGSFLVHQPHLSYNYTQNHQFGPLNLPKWRHLPPTNLPAITQVSFDPKPFANQAQQAIDLFSRPKLLERMGPEVVDMKEVILEALHELRDAGEIDLD